MFPVYFVNLIHFFNYLRILKLRINYYLKMENAKSLKSR